MIDSAASSSCIVESESQFMLANQLRMVDAIVKPNKLTLVWGHHPVRLQKNQTLGRLLPAELIEVATDLNHNTEVTPLVAPVQISRLDSDPGSDSDWCCEILEAIEMDHKHLTRSQQVDL